MKNIPMEVVLDNGSVSYHKNDVLEKWKSGFSRLYDSVEITSELSSDETGLNNVSTQPLSEDMISLFEVKKAVKATKTNKASGVDSIPVEVLKNDSAISCLHILFNVCFRTGKIPTEWGKGIITRSQNLTQVIRETLCHTEALLWHHLCTNFTAPF